jgi:hypothetical protein
MSALATAALAGPKGDLIAADKAVSAMSVAKGNPAAFLAYLAYLAADMGTIDSEPSKAK